MLVAEILSTRNVICIVDVIYGVENEFISF